MKIQFCDTTLQLTHSTITGKLDFPQINFPGGPPELLGAYLTEEQMRDHFKPRLLSYLTLAMQFKRAHSRLSVDAELAAEELDLAQAEHCIKKIRELRNEMLRELTPRQQNLFDLAYYFALGNAKANDQHEFLVHNSPERNELIVNITGCLTAMSGRNVNNW